MKNHQQDINELAAEILMRMGIEKRNLNANFEELSRLAFAEAKQKLSKPFSKICPVAGYEFAEQNGKLVVVKSA